MVSHLWGTASAPRKFLFSEDLENALVQLTMHCTDKNVGEFRVISVGTDINIIDLATQIKSIVGFSELRERSLDGSKMKILEWEPKVRVSCWRERLFE
jgi:hypothetical protein